MSFDYVGFYMKRGMTREQAETKVADNDAVNTRIGNARAAIMAETMGLRTAGIMPCPSCDGQLKYSVASNGHVWGACTTEGCTQWME